MKTKVIMLLLAAVLILITASCAGEPAPVPEQHSDAARVISMGPSITEILVALGVGESIIAADEHSADVAGIPDGIPLFSMRSPDPEQMIALSPDIIFLPGMLRYGGADPFQILSNSGIDVVDIPTSTSIAEIMEDIRTIAAVMGAQDEGEAIVSEMEREIDAIRALASEVAQTRTVYFEIEGAPHMYSFGGGVFLNEMIELAGGVNIFADREGWLSVSPEAVLAANPDVILTNVGWVDDPVGDILNRPGWEAVSAVRNGEVYFIDTNSSSRPTHNMILALGQMARAIHPDKF